MEKKRSPVSIEWEAIAFPIEPPRAGGDPLEWRAQDIAICESKLVRWRELYAKVFVDGEWQIQIEDARLVASLGMSCSFICGHFADAIRIAESFLAHPEIASLKPHELHHMQHEYASSLICAGSIERGCDLIRGITMNEDEKRSPTLMRGVVGGLAICAETMNPDAPVPELMRRLALDAFAGIPNVVWLSKKVAQAATLGEFTELMGIPL